AESFGSGRPVLCRREYGHVRQDPEYQAVYESAKDGVVRVKVGSYHRNRTAMPMCVAVLYYEYSETRIDVIP
ncbi:MAG: hypothetical protein PHX79_05025, partial [Sphaerochaetaceae bacterium]|nr:hypothetical protein [Sphaerochaetaceae bacterium]